jgi:hypothetical protein
MASPRASRGDIALIGAGFGLGLAGALGYAAWRAVSRERLSGAERFAEFGEAMFFPGLLIIAAIGAMVWLGWKANIDG